jgi:hypothetical protein
MLETCNQAAPTPPQLFMEKSNAPSRPIAEYGLSLVSISPALQAEIIRYDRKAAEFVLGHFTRMPKDRVQAIYRLQGCQLRRQWLATKFGMRTRKQLINASNNQDGQTSWIAERRAKGYRHIDHRSMQ